MELSLRKQESPLNSIYPVYDGQEGEGGRWRVLERTDSITPISLGRELAVSNGGTEERGDRCLYFCRFDKFARLRGRRA